MLDAQFPLLNPSSLALCTQCEPCTLQPHFNHNINISKLLLPPKQRLALLSHPKSRFLAAALLHFSLSIPFQHGICHQQAEAGGQRGGHVRAEVELHQLQPHPDDCHLSGGLRGTAGMCSLHPLGICFCPQSTHPELWAGIWLFSPALCAVSANGIN